MNNHPFFQKPIKVVAHRGDSFSFPENTLQAFQSAQDLGVDIIETDVHLTKDNEVVIWHDDTLERNTNGKGRIENNLLNDLKKLDAGYTFTRDGGKTFPFRGKGITLCTLKEALSTLPDTRFNIDLKTKSEKMVSVFLSVIKEMNAENRVICASFHLSNLKLVRKLNPAILTSITTFEVIPLLFRQKLGLISKKAFKRTIIFQVPTKQWGITVINKRFIETMHQKKAIIMVWTINEKENMENLYRLGVDAIMTDNPRLLLKVKEYQEQGK